MLIKSLHLKNLLSFKDARLDLQPLNVLIGANGSGKSNLIDVIALLQAVPGDLPAFFRRNGPTGDWVWKGVPEDCEVRMPEILAAINDPKKPNMPLEYDLRLDTSDDGVKVIHEGLADIRPAGEQLRRVYFSRNADRSGLVASTGGTHPELTGGTNQIRLNPDALGSAQSVFNAIRDPSSFSVLSATAFRLSTIKSYRSWHVGRNSPVRSPQRTDGDPNFLEEDFSNLALVVNDLLSRRLEPSLDSYLKRFYESYESLHPRIFGNTVELVINETGTSSALPASRLSDGTIRFIALLAILCHPDPPPLICIEEPEIAMHPDSLGLIAELMRNASERTQLIVTTHSPELVALFPPEPEAEYVVVCEQDAEEGTRFHRPSYAELREWQDIYQQTGKELVVYGLSEMWLSGALGGVRW
ncbi:MAG: AAA family ATPase [Chloroflexota bacterium]|nr:AAA family ATPase [Chloroflexota bacterium]MDE2958494.1 AAA family ATPase [Chloroflexota bacterium]